MAPPMDSDHNEDAFDVNQSLAGYVDQVSLASSPAPQQPSWANSAHNIDMSINGTGAPFVQSDQHQFASGLFLGAWPPLLADIDPRTPTHAMPEGDAYQTYTSENNLQFFIPPHPATYSAELSQSDATTSSPGRLFYDSNYREFEQKSDSKKYVKKDKQRYRCRIDPMCPRASQGFSDKRSLNRHEDTHRPEKANKCPMHGCRHATRRKDSLLRHMKKVHKYKTK